MHGAWHNTAWAQPYPAKPIRFVMPFPAAKTPNDIVTRLAAELHKVPQLPDTKERFAREGAEPESMPRGAFTEFVRKEIARRRQVVKDAGLQQE